MEIFFPHPFISPITKNEKKKEMKHFGYLPIICDMTKKCQATNIHFGYTLFCVYRWEIGFTTISSAIHSQRQHQRYDNRIENWIHNLHINWFDERVHFIFYQPVDWV